MTMRLIPVLDLQGGIVVRGVGGRRHEYRPVQSVVAQSSDPVEVAISLRKLFGFREFYIADLDAIAGRPSHDEVVSELIRRDLQLLVDCGLRDVTTGRTLVDTGVQRVIAALETSPGPGQLRTLLEAVGPDRVTFSLDMKAGTLLTAGGAWTSPLPETRPNTLADSPVADGSKGELQRSAGSASALAVTQHVLDCGVRSLILLDLAGVGEGRGVPTLGLCRAVRELSPDVEIITGGGVRNTEDLAALERAGADGVLIASALHDGSLTKGDCARWLC